MMHSEADEAFKMKCPVRRVKIKHPVLSITPKGGCVAVVSFRHKKKKHGSWANLKGGG